ncbi:hypothetical protein MHC_02215 [Mycoplasma haemocanis str. Illinois]|uniref:Uncharacterized protein n=1 Tax=Mycoplasma haemocanis (strain Illinois) TaxID=1111676 RepID=H6N6N7_MYCHN|nr:hypothetical protein [Mycoplasma haemocanis]AEW45309.1 hypothetical protein MHC_02215 [Mycoplasma haemocanis str. Illinois]
MSKALLSGSVLTVGTGLGLGVSAIGGARNSQVALTKLKEDVEESVVSDTVQEQPAKCDIYSVQRSDATKGEAKLEGGDFLEKEITDPTLKQQVQSACATSGKAYLAKKNSSWIYRPEDQNKQWTSVSGDEEPKCLLYAVQNSSERKAKSVNEEFLKKEVKDESEKQKIDDACKRTRKAYLANLGSSKGWGYRSSDQSVQWNLVS